MKTAPTLNFNGKLQSPHAAVLFAGAARRRVNHRRNLLLLLILAIFTCVSGSAFGQSSGGATVAVSVRIDTDSATLIKAWRRAQGLDPADAAADAAVSSLMSGSNAARSNQRASNLPSGLPATPAEFSNAAAGALTDSGSPISVNT